MCRSIPNKEIDEQEESVSILSTHRSSAAMLVDKRRQGTDRKANEKSRGGRKADRQPPDSGLRPACMLRRAHSRLPTPPCRWVLLVLSSRLPGLPLLLREVLPPAGAQGHPPAACATARLLLEAADAQGQAQPYDGAEPEAATAHTREALQHQLRLPRGQHHAWPGPVLRLLLSRRLC